MRVVVTGGAGFIGAHLTRALLARGCEVVVVDDLSTGARSNLTGLSVKLVLGSVTDRELMEEACTGAASIVHLAERPSVERSLLDPLATHHVNATGTLTVLDVAQRSETHAVIVSSSAVYGDRDGRPCAESDPPWPCSPYAASKLAAEAYALGHQASFGLPVLVVRLFNVYGPNQSARAAHAAVIPSFIDAALRGRPLNVHGDGRQTRDFTYVGAVAELLAEAAWRRMTHPGPVNLAFGSRTDLLSLVGHLEVVLGRRLEVAHSAPRTGDIRHSRANTDVMRSLFGAVEGQDLRASLAATAHWHRARLHESAAGTTRAVGGPRR
ncbi:GDP-mannose 4,6-dehydratase [Frankia sp. CcI49]|uniref:NAD-dependent epimerase/dehydratase family protein n=1 Tax=unclassified Frankia TaxID=2632575 RepID=UPI0006C9FF3C|nr:MULTISPECIES: NAD-dependent epimerase/dehydratase family protein [unclassified Frankia]KPM57133.1 GDP-D-mannose dehydratase [Frankia sp. R43]ONH60219.1 GDP-mannose 4,6-dehydratase [Frankia sp. CcI49]